MLNRLYDTKEQKAEGYTGKHTFDIITETKTTWRDPFRWQKEAADANRVDLVFTCSLSDFFIQQADPFRARAWDTIKNTPNLIYQILTKRPELIERRLPPDWGRQGYPNVWLGVSVGMSKYLNRMDVLNRIPATARFVSAEPLLEDISRDLPQHIAGFQQIIVGGESGNRTTNFRDMPHEWARSILRVCREHKVAFFFKQSAAIATEIGTTLDGKEYKEYPAAYKQYGKKKQKKQQNTLF